MAVAAVFGTATSVGIACCTAYPAAHPVSLVREKAIIIWNSVEGRQHFIRQASFEGDAENFGFIVPTPSIPEVAEVSEEAFARLEQLLADSLVAESGDTEDTASDGLDSVELIDQYLVGDYEVSILQAKDGASMLDWLSENGYDSRPAMEDWLDHYAQKGWTFAALKFVREPDSETPETKALRISFDADSPFYPYKMPDDTWPADYYRPMALYFIGDGIARASYGSSRRAWEAEILWSGELPDAVRQALATDLGLAASDIPPGAVVTVFNNTTNASGYDRDLAFAEYDSILPTWAVLLIAAFGVGFLVWAIRRRNSKARSPEAT